MCVISFTFSQLCVYVTVYMKCISHMTYVIYDVLYLYITYIKKLNGKGKIVIS